MATGSRNTKSDAGARLVGTDSMNGSVPDAQELRDRVIRVRALARSHQEYRSARLSLGCAEALTSESVREMLATDFGRRYGTKGGYSGGRFLDEVEDIGEQVARDLFGVRHAILSPITGHVAYEAVLGGLTEPGDTVMCLNPEEGGYPTAIVERLGLNTAFHVFDWDSFNLDVEATEQRILETKPRMVVFGSPRYLFAHPVRELLAACREVGAIVGYDASHPFGLIAGKTFDDPISAGVDVLFGSTSKTLFGPTRGLILVRDSDEIRDRIVSVFTRFLLQSTYQLNALAALAVSLAETSAFGEAFAADVVTNARRLANALAAEGIEMIGADRGFTHSQLVLPELSTHDAKEREAVQRRLERAGILSDRFVRFGTQQVTRLGMGTDEMDAIGELAAEVIHSDDEDGQLITRVGAKVQEIAGRYQHLHYSFGESASAFDYSTIAHAF